MEIIIMKELLEANERVAEQNRSWFKENKVLAVNLMGSPGSGKTTLIKALAKELAGIRIGVIEGDIASAIDAEDLQQKGIPSAQINTCGECHLDASVIRQAAEKLGIQNAILFIENVGNLICPAEFDLGESVRLLAASVPEGDDKPFKYVPMFSYIDLVALTKSDLIEAVGFDRENFLKGLRVLSDAEVFELSCPKNGAVKGADALAACLKQRFEAL